MCPFSLGNITSASSAVSVSAALSVSEATSTYESASVSRIHQLPGIQSISFEDGSFSAKKKYTSPWRRSVETQNRRQGESFHFPLTPIGHFLTKIFLPVILDLPEQKEKLLVRL